MTERLKQISEKLKKPRTIIVLGVVGIFLIFASNFIPKSEEKPTKEATAETDITAYTKTLEKQTANLVKKITGQKNVTVVVTLDTGYTYNYVDEIKRNQSDKTDENSMGEEQEYVIITDSSGNQKALLVNEQLPEIRGVAVVYGGKDSKVLNEKIEKALCAAFQITTKRIYISGEGGQ